ncbi:MAG TPA: aldo/keto reductase [Gemmatimonadaceae bacterium]|nr:aldo/keto reductase [Gemmatimonadaceae bacterium]
MDTRKIGSLSVSIVGLGCNNFGNRLGADASAKVIDAALDNGINFLDTADIYGKTLSEEYVGRALAGRRDQVVIATKVGKPVDDDRRGARPEYVKLAAEDSLRRLRTDYIDLYQIHEPDPTVPIEDTIGALNELVREGKVREIGCSNFNADDLRGAEAAVPRGGARFASVQNEYSLLHRVPEDDVIPLCEELGIAFLPYYPLHSGLLTGKFRRGKPAPEGTRIANSAKRTEWMADEKMDAVESLIAFAESRGHTILELAFSWLLSRPVVASVIAGATSSSQAKSNASAASWKLTDYELKEIDRIVERKQKAESREQ